MAVGARGRVLFSLPNNSFPVVELAIKMATPTTKLTVGHVPTVDTPTLDLRDQAGLYFSVPRTPGDYNITVFAKDSTGCTTETTAVRTVTVF